MSAPKFFHEVNGEWAMSAEAMAVLCGVPLSEVRAKFSAGKFHFPAEWNKAARRRMKEHEALIGEEDLPAAINHFYAKEGMKP